MARPARPEPPPVLEPLPEPATKSYAELVAWLHGPPRRGQAPLAMACHVSQTMLSFYACRRARPHPDSEVARLLELATDGRVTRLGWLTREELDERRRQEERAVAYARAIVSGRRVCVRVTKKLMTEPPSGGASDDREGLRAGRERDGQPAALALPPASSLAPAPGADPAVVDKPGAAGRRVDHADTSPVAQASAPVPGRSRRRSRRADAPSLPDIILQRSHEAGR